MPTSCEKELSKRQGESQHTRSQAPRESILQECQDKTTSTQDCLDNNCGGETGARVALKDFVTCDVECLGQQELEPPGLRVAVLRSLKRLHHGVP